MLAVKNSHARDVNIQFSEVGHKYTIGDGSVTYTSVTSFIKPLFEEFDADAVIHKMMTGSKWRNSKYYGLTVEEIKSKWDLAGKEAAAAGTALHADIEHFYNGEQVANESVEFTFFMAFQSQCTLTPYRTEWTIYDESSRIAGSIDMVFQRSDGQLEIYDWKRVKQIDTENNWNKWGRGPINHLPDTNYWHYALQLNMYKYILQKKYGVQVAAMYLIVLHPSKICFEKVEVLDLSSTVNDLMHQNMLCPPEFEATGSKSGTPLPANIVLKSGSALGGAV